MTNFSGLALSRIEMKNVKGGWVTYDCVCSGRVGAWTGTYKNAQGASNALGTYCGGVGSCGLRKK